MCFFFLKNTNIHIGTALSYDSLDRLPVVLSILYKTVQFLKVFPHSASLTTALCTAMIMCCVGEMWDTPTYNQAAHISISQPVATTVLPTTMKVEFIGQRETHKCVYECTVYTHADSLIPLYLVICSPRHLFLL